MEIIPLAADSIGTRSMACLVRTDDATILIDPGAALGPKRYNKQPHPKEEAQLEADLKSIRQAAAEADVLIISHYHYDHYIPDDASVYEDKALLIKHPTENINKSQQKRAKEFLDLVSDKPKELYYADGKVFTYGKTNVTISPAVFHGASSKLGYVVETLVDDGTRRFLHGSDIQGPVHDDQAQFILDNKPHVAYFDGPLSYMLGFRYSHENLNSSIENLKRIASLEMLETLIIDHHFLRDKRWKEHLAGVFETAQQHKTKILTVAEFLGKENLMLEAHRNQLWKEGS
ncbi:MAG: MBL fold metallo-hydrolase [Candidatus Woesearchaeota archaeon]